MKRLTKEEQKAFILNVSGIFEENKSILKEFYLNGNLNLSRAKICLLLNHNNKIIENHLIKLFEYIEGDLK